MSRDQVLHVGPTIVMHSMYQHFLLEIVVLPECTVKGIVHSVPEGNEGLLYYVHVYRWLNLHSSIIPSENPNFVFLNSPVYLSGRSQEDHKGKRKATNPVVQGCSSNHTRCLLVSN